MQAGDPATRPWETLKANFRPFLEAAPDAIIIVDESGDIVLAHPLTHSLFGYSESEVTVKPIEVCANSGTTPPGGCSRASGPACGRHDFAENH